MSRRGRRLRRWAATALLLGVVLTWVPLANASGGGSLTRKYPIGTQTLCCQAGPGHARSGTTTTAASTPRTGHRKGDSGISILVVVAIVVIAFAPAAFVFRAGFSLRRRAPRPDPHAESEGASATDAAPAPDDAAPDGISRSASGVQR